jgi:hypothetical protein
MSLTQSGSGAPNEIRLSPTEASKASQTASRSALVTAARCCDEGEPPPLDAAPPEDGACEGEDR